MIVKTLRQLAASRRNIKKAQRAARAAEKAQRRAEVPIYKAAIAKSRADDAKLPATYVHDRPYKKRTLKIRGTRRYGDFSLRHPARNRPPSLAQIINRNKDMTKVALVTNTSMAAAAVSVAYNNHYRKTRRP